VEQIIAESGRSGLRRLPGIGSSLADKIVDLVRCDDFATLNPEEELAGVA
jgi:hypothetical protein